MPQKLKIADLDSAGSCSAAHFRKKSGTVAVRHNQSKLALRKANDAVWVKMLSATGLGILQQKSASCLLWWSNIPQSISRACALCQRNAARSIVVGDRPPQIEMRVK